MNQHRFAAMLLCAAMAFFLISCGGGSSSEQKSTSDSTSTDTTSATAPTTQPEANTTVTAPQNMLVVTHKVKDYDKWKPLYEGHDTARVSHGIHSYIIGRGETDPNMVLVAMKIDDVDKAKAFTKDPSLKKAMQEGGVMGAPTINFYTIVWQDTAAISTTLRSRSMFTVKDWDRWQRVFDSTRKLNSDNGLKLRAYGHNLDDPHKVVVVSDIVDSTKANAYFKSDMLKQRMVAGGVVGQLNRFIYNVVQKY
jgi:hypothetical protein